jgi:large subunit ribosomal protein L25
MEQITLSARIRREKGKGAARKIRRDNQIPAIFYGPGQEPVMLAVEESDLQGILKQSAGENAIVGLQIKSDKGRETRTVMLKEVQTDPILDTVFHADFYEISMDKELTIDIPIQLVNTPVGVTEGGILQQVKREVSVTGLPAKLVDVLEADVSELAIGDSLHLSAIEIPEGITLNEEETLTIAVVAAPTVVEEPEEEVEEEEALEEGAEAEGEAEAESKSESKSESKTESKPEE